MGGGRLNESPVYSSRQQVGGLFVGLLPSLGQELKHQTTLNYQKGMPVSLDVVVNQVIVIFRQFPGINCSPDAVASWALLLPLNSLSRVIGKDMLRN